MSREVCIDPPGGGWLSASAPDDKMNLSGDTEAELGMDSAQCSDRQCETECISRDTTPSKSDDSLSNGSVILVSPARDVKDDTPLIVHDKFEDSFIDEDSKKADGCVTFNLVNNESFQVSDSVQADEDSDERQLCAEDKEFMNATALKIVDDDSDVTLKKTTGTCVPSVNSCIEHETEESLHSTTKFDADISPKNGTPKDVPDNHEEDLLDIKRENIPAMIAGATISVDLSEIGCGSPEKDVFPAEAETISRNTRHDAQFDGQVESEMQHNNQGLNEEKSGEGVAEMELDSQTIKEGGEVQTQSNMQQDDEAMDGDNDNQGLNEDKSDEGVAETECDSQTIKEGGEIQTQSNMQQDDEAMDGDSDHQGVTEFKPDVTQQPGMNLQNFSKAESNICNTGELCLSEVKTPTRNVEEDDETESEGWNIKISDVRTLSFDEEEEESESAMTIIDLNESVGLTSDTSQFESPDCKSMSRLETNEAKSTDQQLSSPDKSVTDSSSTKHGIGAELENKDDESMEISPTSGQQGELTFCKESNAGCSDQTPASSLLSTIAKTLENLKSEPMDIDYGKAAKEPVDGNQTNISKTSPSKTSVGDDSVSKMLQNRNDASISITPMLPSPRLVPFLSIIATTAKTMPTSSSGSSTTAHTDSTSLSSTSSCSELPESFESDKNLLQSNSNAESSKADKEKQEEKDSGFLENIVSNFHKHSLKTISLDDITQFLQRKNCVRTYRAPPPNGTGLSRKDCVECGDSFLLQQSLDCHMSRCSMKIIFFCSNCDATLYLVNKCQLLSHIRKHTQVDKNNHLKPLKINSDYISVLTPTAKDIHYFITTAMSKSEEPEKVKCMICNQQFPDESALKTHFGTDDLICSLIYKCSSCTRVMPRQCSFNAHLALHGTPQNIIVCPECGKPFTTDGKAFIRHINNECFHNRRVFFLTCCGEKLEGLVQTREHFLKKHVKQYIKCQFCNVAYEKKERFHVHLQDAHNVSPNNNLSFVRTCQLCKSLFKTDDFLLRHVDSHVNEMKKNAQFGFKCIHCSVPRLFSSKRLLAVHEAHVHKVLHLLTCNSCGLTFRTESSLQTHRNLTHFDQPHLVKNNKSIPIQCTKCKQTFTRPQGLSSHQCTAGVTGTKTAPPVTVLVCVRCREVLPNNTFSKHVCPKTNTVTNKPFPVKVLTLGDQPVQALVPKIRRNCNFCLKIFDADELQKHMDNCPSRSSRGLSAKQHTNIKAEQSHQTSPTTPGSLKRKLQSTRSFKCCICTVGFPSQKRLDVHMQTHSSEGALLCKICHARYFNTQAELSAHVAECTAVGSKVSKISKDEMKCPVCKSYCTKYNLTMVRHLKTHSLKGVLVCCYCHKTDFANHKELCDHERTCGADSYPLEQGFCFLCQTDCCSLDWLVVHLQKHVLDGSLICCKCQKTGFQTSSELDQHMDACGKNLLEDVTGGICTLCRKLFHSEREALQKHITEHCKKGALICCYCQKMGWKTHGEMKSHTIYCGAITGRNSKPPVKFRCTICSASFFGWDMLKRHQITHSSQGQKNDWKDTEELTNQMKDCLQSLGASSPSKSKIPKEFDNTNVNDSSRDTFKTMDQFCEYCGKRFFKLSSLLEHIKQEHTSFPCHLCGVAYESKANLVNHVNMVHDGKRSLLTCDICKAKNVSKYFTSQNGLDRHTSKMHKHARRRSNSTDSKEQVNTENESVACSSDKPSPKKRLRIEGDAVYTCAKCAFVTENDGEFAEHIKQHNADKTNQCPDCGLCFAVLPTLKKHLFMVHKIRDADKYLQKKGMKTEEEEMDSDAEDFFPFAKKSSETENVNIIDDEESHEGNELECRVCYKQFENEKLLKTHMRIHGMAFIRSKKRGEARSSPTGATRSSSSTVAAAAEGLAAVTEDQEEEKPEASVPSLSSLLEEEDEPAPIVQIKQEPMDM